MLGLIRANRVWMVAFASLDDILPELQYTVSAEIFVKIKMSTMGKSLNKATTK
jgi:hypothetical protein